MANSETHAAKPERASRSRPHRANPLDAPGRRRPKQERSKRTVEQLLDAAIRVMERGGFEALTMRAVADEAGINVATLYSYFANKHKLLARLAEDRLTERLDMLHEAFEKARKAEDWIAATATAISQLTALRARQTGSRALRSALHASPELWRIDQNGNKAAARMMAQLLQDRANPPCKDPELRGRIIAEYVTALLDMHADYPEHKHRDIEAELMALLKLHLSMP